MSSVYNYFFKTPAKTEVKDPMALYIPEDLQEQLLCFVLSDCTLYSLIPKNSKQVKQCDFMHCSLSLGSQEIELTPTSKMVIPVIRISNDDYDEDQDQKAEEVLPITEELLFMRYSDGADHMDDECTNEVQGFVFYYPTISMCKVIEIECDSEQARKDVQEFQKWLCTILFVVNEQSPILNSKSRDVQQRQLERQAVHCFQISLAILLKQQQLSDVFNYAASKQKSADPKVAKRQGMRELQTHFLKETRDTRSEFLAKQMANLKVGQEDLRDNTTLGFTVEERLIQVQGHFFKYDALLERNILIKADVFMAVDKVQGGNYGGKYIINVFDLSGKVSYTIYEIQDNNQMQLDSRDSVLMWIGNQRATGEVPAWCFKVDSKDFGALRGVLAKAIIETKTRLVASSQENENDADWLNAAVIADDDIEMADSSRASEQASEGSQIDPSDVIFDADEFDELELLERTEAKIDEDLEPEVRESETREFLQVLGYDRAFCVKGPVIKIYKNEESKGQHQRLEYVMHLPMLKDSKGNILEPENLLLHNNENNLLFKDRMTNQLINFDLESGKIVDQIQQQSDLITNNQITICNEGKNSQISASAIFQAISQKAMFTIDTRLATGSKVACERVYKKSPMFSTIATTTGGQIAIGSMDGAIRLYKQVGQDAKTLLPGLQDPIISIEVSRDSEWILATTKSYILIIPTKCDNGKTGFEHRMGKEKPNPKKLQLSPTDIAKFQISTVSFKPARFNNFTSNGTESSIVSSTGDFLITWSFKHVKKGQLNKYKIQKLSVKPVDSQFQVNNDQKIIVADDHALGFQTRAKKVSFQY